MGTQEIAEGSDLVTQPQLICPHLPETRKKEDKKERATVWCPSQFSITHSKTTSSPESEDELKVAKSKSISGFLAKSHKHIGPSTTLKLQPAVFSNPLTCHITQLLSEEKLTSTDHAWTFVMQCTQNSFISLQRNFTLTLNSSFLIPLLFSL